MYAVDGSALDQQMGVAPRCVLCSAKVSHSNVHATDESQLTIDDTKFAVVAVVDLAGECRKVDGHESMHVDTANTQALEEGAGHTPTSYIIVDETDFDTLARFVDENICDESSQRVVIDDICREVDMVAGLANGFQKRGEECISVGVNLHIVVFERQSPVLLSKLSDECFVLLGQLQVALFDKAQHRALGQLVEASLADVFLLSRVLSEEIIEHNAHKRNEQQDEYPRHSLGRLSVVHQYGKNCSYDGGDIDDEYGPVDVDHDCSVDCYLNPTSLCV